MCVRACVLATAPVEGGFWTAEKVLTSIGIRRADACHRPPPPPRLFPFILLRIRYHILLLFLLLLLLLF